MTTPPERHLVPCFKTFRKSRGERRGSMSGSETLPALETTRLEGGTTGPCLHSMPEAMFALPTSHLWLVSPFHRQRSVEGEGSTGYEVCGSYVKVSPSRSKTSHPGNGHRVREEFGWVAKRTHGPFLVIWGPIRHGNLWKNHILPGVFLWIDGAIVIHTVDFRVLDDPVTPGRYSPA